MQKDKKQVKSQAKKVLDPNSYVDQDYKYGFSKPEDYKFKSDWYSSSSLELIELTQLTGVELIDDQAPNDPISEDEPTKHSHFLLAIEDFEYQELNYAQVYRATFSWDARYPEVKLVYLYAEPLVGRYLDLQTLAGCPPAMCFDPTLAARHVDFMDNDG